jgi:penicillin-binding protein 1A
MYHEKMITFAEAKALMKAPLVYKEYIPMNAATVPYWIDYVKQDAERLLKAKNLRVEGQGLRIYTTLDTSLQRLAEGAVDGAGATLDAAAQRTRQVKLKDGTLNNATVEAALLSVDPRNGEILAMVGGRDYQKSKFNRTYQSLRSPGSAFKPVVYSLALQSKWKWSDMLYVSPITIDNYRPHTPDGDMLTETTLMRAFYRSMNTPTVELGEKLGLRNVVAQAQRLGIRSKIKEEFGTTLGSSDTSLMDLARMYSTFANSGNQVEIIGIKRITDRSGKVIYKAPPPTERSKQVITPQIAYLMTQGMRAVLTMGTGFASAHLSGVAAGKTGTSNESTDNWFCGYAPNLATVVWIGTDEHVPMRGDVTGGKLALPVWDHYMTKAFERRPPTPFEAPPGLVWTTVNPKFGNRSPDGVKMYFLRGNEPPAESSDLEALSQSTEGGYRDVFAH